MGSILGADREQHGAMIRDYENDFTAGRNDWPHEHCWRRPCQLELEYTQIAQRRGGGDAMVIKDAVARIKETRSIDVTWWATCLFLGF